MKQKPKKPAEPQRTTETKMKDMCRSRRIRVDAFVKGVRRCPCCKVQMTWQACDKQAATVEHIIPKSVGGTYDRVNILVSCAKCNNGRATKNWLVFVDELTKLTEEEKEELRQMYYAALKFYASQKIVNMGIFRYDAVKQRSVHFGRNVYKACNKTVNG